MGLEFGNVNTYRRLRELLLLALAARDKSERLAHEICDALRDEVRRLDSERRPPLEGRGVG